MDEAPIVNPAIRPCDHQAADGTRCTNEGTWMPMLLLYPSRLHWPSAALPVQIDMGYCGLHKETVTVQELATERIYEIAEKACANAKAPWPERSETRLKWVKWVDSSLGRMKTQELAARN